MSVSASSYAQIPLRGDDETDTDEVDSLPSTSTGSTTPMSPSDDDDDDASDEGIESDAEREWRESLQQLELMLTMVLVPYLGKYFGRKFAYWGWGRFMEWKYPVTVSVTNPTLFKAAGAVQAAASL